MTTDQIAEFAEINLSRINGFAGNYMITIIKGDGSTGWLSISDEQYLAIEKILMNDSES